MIERFNKIFSTTIKINLIITLIVTLIAPYSSGEMVFYKRFLYWGVIVFTSWYSWVIIERYVEPRINKHYIFVTTLTTFLMTIPLVTVIVGLEYFALDARFTGSELLYLWLGLLVTSQCVSALIYYIIYSIKNQNSDDIKVDNKPHFLKNIAGELLYIKSEDHYLRICTTVEEKLILYKLKDAIIQLEVEGFEGMMTHRSYWVAKAAIKSSGKDGRKSFLILNNAEQLPISATYLKALKEADYI